MNNLQLSPGGVFRFVSREKPNDLVFKVNKVAKANGQTQLKATCWCKHGVCGLWVTKHVSGVALLELLEKEIRWGVAGITCSEDDSYKLSVAIKRAYGMKV